jgi:hypothetical protein
MTKHDLVALANAHRATMARMSPRAAMAYVTDLVANADVAVGVFTDSQSHDGVGLYTIKGTPELQAIIGSGDGEWLRVTAIPCICLEQAMAARKVIGDGARKLN